MIIDPDTETIIMKAADWATKEHINSAKGLIEFEDMKQQCILAVYERADKIDWEQNYEAYIKKICRTAAKSLLNKTFDTPLPDSIDKENAVEVASDINVEDEFITNKEHSSLLKLVKKLCRKYKVKFIRGESLVANIARVVDFIGVEGVSDFLSIPKQTLKDILIPYRRQTTPCFKNCVRDAYARGHRTEKAVREYLTEVGVVYNSSSVGTTLTHVRREQGDSKKKQTKGIDVARKLFENNPSISLSEFAEKMRPFVVPSSARRYYSNMRSK